MYKLRYGVSGMSKTINESQYDDLSLYEKYYYEKAVIRQCSAHERDSISNIEYEKSTENLANVVKQTFYD